MIDLLDIVGQDPAVARLQRAMGGSRVPHAYIFAGPAGVGRRTTALALARTLLCGDPQKQPNAGRFADLPDDFTLRAACGHCRDCQMTAAGSHPDLHLVYKELARYHDDANVRARVMQDLGIDVIRSFLIAPAGRCGARGRGKVFVVLEADLMSPPAQNALLKTLEEPPRGVTIILISDRPQQLLETTQSRCAIVRFGLLPRDFVSARLAEQGLSKDEAAFWAAFTGGSLGRAGILAARGMYEIRQDLVERLADLRSSGDAELGQYLTGLTERLAAAMVDESKSAEDALPSKALASRRAASDMLELIASIYRDALTAATGAEAERIHADHAASIEAIAGRFPSGQLCEIIDQLCRYERLLWRNVNPKIVWDNVAITCATAAPLGMPDGL